MPYRTLAGHNQRCARPLAAGMAGCDLCGWTPPGPPPGQLDALIARMQREPRDVALIIKREALAPPPLGEIADDVMLAVASGYGKIPEEWQDTWPHPFWFAWPGAAGAVVHAEEMTAGQLRDRLAELAGHG